MAKKVLMIEDEPDIIGLVAHYLEKEGYRVTAVRDGAKGLQQIKAEPPDLLILDVVMPDSDGYEVGKALRQDKAFLALPIIYMTGKDLEYSGMVRRAEELGYCDFVTKPCTFKELLEKVREALP